MDTGPNKKLFLSFVKDLTEQRNIEMVLEEKSKQANDLFNQMELFKKFFDSCPVIMGKEISWNFLLKI